MCASVLSNMKPSVVSAATGNPLNPLKNTVIRFPTSELVCSMKLEIYLSPRSFHGRQVIFLFSSLTSRRDLKNDVRQRTEKFLAIQEDHQVLLFDVSMFFRRFCNFKTMTSNSYLLCDLKESWQSNGPNCGFMSWCFVECYSSFFMF